MFGSSKRIITDFKDKRLGIDASYDIYRAGTVDENNILNMIVYWITRYKRMGAISFIFVFDNPVPNPLKAKEHAKRDKTRTFRITKKIIDDVKSLLHIMGIAWVTAPEGYEAEHLGAELTKNNIIDTFMTSDSDTLVFGGTSMTRYIKGVFEEYRLSDALALYGLDTARFLRICVMMGCDFADKTRGIGPKTSLKKEPNTVLTSEQKIAIDYFNCTCVCPSIVRNMNYSASDAIEWFADNNFSRAQITPLIGNDFKFEFNKRLHCSLVKRIGWALSKTVMDQQQEEKWGTSVTGQADWVDSMGKMLVYDMLKLKGIHLRNPDGKDNVDWECDNYIYKVETLSWNTVDGRILDTWIKHQNTPEIYNKPLRIICVARQENLLNPTEKNTQILNLAKSWGIEYIRFRDTL